MENSPLSSQKKRFLLCFSPKDVEGKKELVAHLAPSREGLSVWSVDEVPAGASISIAFQEEATSADAALLLLSANFFVALVEPAFAEQIALLRQQQTERGLLLIPILWRDCQWRMADWLSALQPLPTNGVAIRAMDQAGRDRAFTEIAGLLDDRQETRLLAGLGAFHPESKIDPDGLPPADEPNKDHPRPSSRLRDFAILATGGLLWEKLRSALSLVMLQFRALSKSLKVQVLTVLTAIGLGLIAVGMMLLESPRPPTGAEVDMRSSDSAKGKQVGQLPGQKARAALSDDKEVAPQGNRDTALQQSCPPPISPLAPPISPATRPPSPLPHAAASLGKLNITASTPIFGAQTKTLKNQTSAVEDSPSTPALNATLDLRSEVASRPEYVDMGPPPITDLAHAESPPPDLAKGALALLPKVTPEPSLLVCPGSVSIQIEPGSDTKVDPHRAAEQLIAEMKIKASSATRIIAPQNCSTQAQGGNPAIQISAMLKIQNKLIGVKSICPANSTKNCYKSVERKIICNFTFAITQQPVGYVCGKMKSEPPEYEITYYENEIDPFKWSANRRGDEAMKQCRHLVGLLTTANLCQPR